MVSPVVSLVPSPNATAAPARAASTPVEPSSRQAATAGNDAAKRSFWPVTASRATTENVASSADAPTEGRTA